MDPLSQLFQALRVERALCTRFEATSPWGHQVTHRGQIKLVLLVEGSAWLRTRALREPTLLGPDDLFLVLSSEPYTLSSSPRGAVIDCAELEPLRDGYLIRYGGGGARAVILSVAFDVDPAATEALLLALPPFVHLRVERSRSHKLQALIDLLRLEVAAAELGCLPIVQRLAETLFLSSVRAYLQQAESPLTGVLAAIADAQLAKPLGEMQSDLARPWSLEDLARSAGMSRSSFAAKFRAVVGRTPLDYLGAQRMDRARALLRSGEPISAVAGRVGYESAISFTRAFRRITGRTPGSYRREVAAREERP